MIYVDGGNTFYLQRHIIESSFWDAIDSNLKEGSLPDFYGPQLCEFFDSSRVETREANSI
jgi:peptidase E